MPVKHDAAWWREYRAKRKFETVAAAKGAPPAGSPERAAGAESVRQVVANVHAACDAKIAALEAEVRRLKTEIEKDMPGGVSRETFEAQAKFAAATVHLSPEEVATAARVTAKPSFLAAPDEDCVCGHDRHSYHLAGSCSAFIRPKTKCSCTGFQADLGFE